MATTEGQTPPDCYNQPSQQSLVLECTVCAENYGLDFDHQSRSLKCGHTFCTKCMMKIMTSRGVKCPMCNMMHTLSSPDVMLLPINYAVQDILKNISDDDKLIDSQQPERPRCGVCPKPATIVCVDCEPGSHFHFCVMCDKEEHLRPFGPVQRHRRFPSDKAPVIGTFTGCVRHPNVTVALYSETLNEFACSVCISEEDWPSKGIHFEPLGQATKKLQGRVQKLSKHTQDILNRLNVSKQMLEDILTNLEPASINVKAEINTRFSSLIEALQERQKILLAIVDVELKNRRENLETQLHMVVSSTTKYRDTFESLNSLLSNTDVEFLRLYPSATKHIDSLIDSEDKGLLRPVINQNIPFYINKDIEKELKTLGAVGGGVTPTDLEYSSVGSQGTLMELLWQLPEQFGKVNRFQIEYDQLMMERRDSGFLVGVESDPLTFTQNEPQFFEIAGSKLNAYMDYLCPGYGYQFRIRSANDAGWGMWSKPVMGTCEGFPFTLNYTKSIHRVVIPTSSYYRITVKGAKAEDGMVRRGGKGAVISGIFSLKAGEVLILLCGGMSSRHHYHSGGGGGSFVAVNEISLSNLLIAAGGGGGTRGASDEDWHGSDASLTPDGEDGLGEDAGKGGINGGPGMDSKDKASEGPSFGNGGAGFLQNSSTAMSFLSGGHGGQNGGFGGGGAVGMYGGGGGGGYSGGGGGRGGGGGGSYISSAALDINKEVGSNGHGSITIDKVMPPYPLAEEKVAQTTVDNKLVEGNGEAGSNTRDVPLYSQSSSGTTGSMLTSLSSKALSGTSVGTIPEAHLESPATTSQVMDQSKLPPPAVVSFSVGTDFSSCSDNSSRGELCGRSDATDQYEVDTPVPPVTWKPAPEMAAFVPTLEEYFGPSQPVVMEAGSVPSGYSIATMTSTAVKVSEIVTLAPNYSLSCNVDVVDPNNAQHTVKDQIELHESLTDKEPIPKDGVLLEDMATTVQQLSNAGKNPSQSPSSVLLAEDNNANINSVRSSTADSNLLSQRTTQQPPPPRIGAHVPANPAHVAPAGSGASAIGTLTSEHAATLQWLLQQQNLDPRELQQKLVEVQMFLQAQQQQQQQQQVPQQLHQQLVIQASGQEELSPPTTQQLPYLAPHQLRNQQPPVVLGQSDPSFVHQQSYQQSSYPPHVQSVQPVHSVQSQQPLVAVQGVGLGVRDQGNHSPPLVSQQTTAAVRPYSQPSNGLESDPVQYRQQPPFDYSAPNWNSNH